MSIFTPFRSKKVVRGTILLGGALKIAHLLTPMEPLYAQQNQQVNIAQIGGVAPIPAICDNSTGITSTIVSFASTQAQIVGSTVSSNIVYICGWNFTTPDSSVVLTWVQGTSTDCTSNVASLSGGYNFSSKSGMVVGNAGYPQFKTSSGNTLCLDVTSTSAVGGGLLTYKIST